MSTVHSLTPARRRLQRLGVGSLSGAFLLVLALNPGELPGDEETASSAAPEAAASNRSLPTADDASRSLPASSELAAEAAGAAADQIAALGEGKALFRGLCSGCHGGAGRGGKGPDLTDDRWLHGSADVDIARVIQNGVPGTTMKKLGESLNDEQIAKIIAYVRSLARAPGESTWQPYLAGDPQAGEQLFFEKEGKAQCSKCHTVAKRGGRVGPTLDRLAVRRAPEYIMESILEPSKDIDPSYEAVQVVTADGRQLQGLRVNETNFSIQLREENGRFHSFQKRNLDEFAVMSRSLMPDNFAQQFSVKELHDLFAYLMSLE